MTDDKHSSEGQVTTVGLEVSNLLLKHYTQVGQATTDVVACRIFFIKCRYDEELKDGLKALGGVWQRHAWAVPLENEREARDIALATVGHDGSRRDQVNVVLHFRQGAQISTDRKGMNILGENLFRLSNEDVKPYDHVQIIAGEIERQGDRLWYRAPIDAEGKIRLLRVARQRAEKNRIVVALRTQPIEYEMVTEVEIEI